MQIRFAGRRTVGIKNDRYPPETRHELFQQLQPLASRRWLSSEEAGGIVTRPRQALDNALLHRIARHYEDDGDGPGRLLQGQRLRCPDTEKHIRPRVDQFLRAYVYLLDVAIGPTVVDLSILTVCPT